MDPISLEELALLDVLMLIEHFSDQHHSAPLRERLVDGGLVEAGAENSLRLTDAGVQLCKSLHHRIAADAEAAAVLKKREESGESAAEAESAE